MTLAFEGVGISVELMAGGEKIFAAEASVTLLGMYMAMVVCLGRFSWVLLVWFWLSTVFADRCCSVRNGTRTIQKGLGKYKKICRLSVTVRKSQNSKRGHKDNTRENERDCVPVVVVVVVRSGEATPKRNRPQNDCTKTFA